jgi:hypothetical protein
MGHDHVPMRGWFKRRWFALVGAQEGLPYYRPLRSFIWTQGYFRWALAGVVVPFLILLVWWALTATGRESAVSADAWILAGVVSGVFFVAIVVAVLRAPAAQFHQVSAALAASIRACEEFQVQLLEERTSNAERADQYRTDVGMRGSLRHLLDDARLIDHAFEAHDRLAREASEEQLDQFFSGVRGELRNHYRAMSELMREHGWDAAANQLEQQLGDIDSVVSVADAERVAKQLNQVVDSQLRAGLLERSEF